MTPERYQSVREIFHELVDLSPSGRRARLDALANLEIRNEVSRLLDYNDREGNVLDEPALAPVQTLKSGDAVGRFKIIRLIGYGGMGEVFEAEDTKFSTRVAIKTIAPEWLGDHDSELRFIRENKLARRITHPNVCRIYEYLEEQRSPYTFGVLVMELLEGETLEELVRREGPLPIARARPILAGILDGLEAAHDVGVIHRDLKPANVMITRQGRAVVTDFGLAKSVRDEDQQTARIQGTISYMAPEQRHGDSSVRSDVYSLGLVVHFMVAGRLPGTDAAPLRYWRGPIRNCIATSPADRYATVKEVRNAFLPKPLYSRRGWVAASVAVLGGVAAAVVSRNEGMPVPPGTDLYLAGLQNNTGDQSLLSLGSILSSQIEQSPHLRVVNSLPQGFQGVTLNPGIRQDGDGFLLQFRLNWPRRGASRTRSFKSASRADLFATLRAASLWVRQVTGESPSDIAELDAKPQSATTASWDALLAFSRAEREFDAGRRPEALIALDEALRWDPEFALAQMRKGDILFGLGRDTDGLQAWHKAVTLAEKHRLTRREEFRIRAMFFADTWSYAEAVRAYEAFGLYYPRDPQAFRARARPLLLLGRGPQALEVLRQAIAIEPGDATAHASMAWNACVLGDTALAHRELAEAAQRGPRVGAKFALFIAFVEGRYGELPAWFEKTLAGAPAVSHSGAVTLYAHMLAERSQWPEFESILTRGIEFDRSYGLTSAAESKSMALLWFRLRYSKRGPDIDSSVSSLRDVVGLWTRTETASLLARAGLVSQARDLAANLAVPFTAPIFEYARRRMDGEILIAEGTVGLGISSLRKAAAAMAPAWPKEFLAWGCAHGDPPAAVAEYKRVAAGKGILWHSNFFHRPGIWADSLAALARLDPDSRDACDTALRQLRSAI
ncbi:MAG TPA: protein kinase [Bryobacteraceae bacterium]|nr:protein kinase [Bryobacteraceae bacterium]